MSTAITKRMTTIFVELYDDDDDDDDDVDVLCKYRRDEEKKSLVLNGILRMNGSSATL